VRSIIWIIAAVLVVGVGLVVWHINRHRVVGSAVAPNGTEMRIIQRFNWSAEPFTTNFVFRKPGGAWRGFYYDHQDGYWGSSRSSLDNARSVAVFYRGNAPAVTFNWATETYTLHRLNRTEKWSDVEAATQRPPR
jgi:hypothetical protein